MIRLISSILHRPAAAGAVVHAFHTAENAGNVEAELALFTDDAVVRITPAPPGTTGVWTGKAQIGSWPRGRIVQYFRNEEGTAQVTGDTVTSIDAVSNDGFRRLGVDPVQFNEVVVVRDGKIASLTGTITPVSVAALKAAVAKAPAGVAQESSSMPASGAGGARHLPTPAVPLLLVALGSGVRTLVRRHGSSMALDGRSMLSVLLAQAMAQRYPTLNPSTKV